jgi:hypothetical protein
MALDCDPTICDESLLMHVRYYDEDGTLRHIHSGVCKALSITSNPQMRRFYVKEVGEMMAQRLEHPGVTFDMLRPAIETMNQQWDLLGVFLALERVAPGNRPVTHGPVPEKIPLELSPQEANALLACIAFFVRSGMGDPGARDKPLLDLSMGVPGSPFERVSLMDDGLRALFQRISAAYGIEDRLSFELLRTTIGPVQM